MICRHLNNYFIREQSQNSQQLQPQSQSLKLSINYPFPIELLLYWFIVDNTSQEQIQKYFLLMFPQQKTLPYQPYIPPNHSVRATLNTPLSSSFRMGSPISPQNISSNNQIPNKNFMQSLSTTNLPRYSTNQNVNEHPKQYHGNPTQIADKKKGVEMLHSPKAKNSSKNFQKLKEFMQKNKYRWGNEQNQRKVSIPENSADNAIIAGNKKIKNNVDYKFDFHKRGFSPIKMPTGIKTPKNLKEENQHKGDHKKPAKAYLRMTLDPRLDQRKGPNSITPDGQKKQKSHTGGFVHKQPRKTEQNVPSGSFWKKKGSPSKNQRSQPISSPKIQQIPHRQEQISIPPLNLKTQQQNSKPSFIPYRKNIQRFKIIKKLGSGIFSDCYLCIDKKIGWIACLKAIRKISVNNAPANTLQSLIKQLKFQFFINHSNIISGYDVFCDSQFVYVVEELMTDGKIDEWNGQRLGEETSDKILEMKASELTDDKVYKQDRKEVEMIQKFAQINLALSAIHSTLKVPHGDISPSSIYLTFDTCKLSSYIPEQLRQTITRSNSFKTPEELVGRKQTPKSDMWCLGLLLFSVLTGRDLLSSQSFEESVLAHKILELNVDRELLTANISNPVKELIRALLKINPDERISSQALRKSSLVSIYNSQQKKQKKLIKKSTDSPQISIQPPTDPPLNQKNPFIAPSQHI